MIENILDRIYTTDIVESVKEVRAQWVDKDLITPQVFDFFLKNDPTSTKKYLNWMCKVKYNTELWTDHIVDLVKEFEAALKQRKIDQKYRDIYKLAPEQVQQLIVQAKGNLSKKEQKTAPFVHEDAPLVFENKKCYVYKILSHEAAYAFGNKVTSWCIAGSNDGAYWFKQYTQRDGVAFYFVLLKADGAKIAISVYNDAEHDQFEIFNSGNHGITDQILEDLEIPEDILEPSDVDTDKVRNKFVDRAYENFLCSWEYVVELDYFWDYVYEPQKFQDNMEDIQQRIWNNYFLTQVDDAWFEDWTNPPDIDSDDIIRSLQTEHILANMTEPALTDADREQHKEDMMRSRATDSYKQQQFKYEYESIEHLLEGIR